MYYLIDISKKNFGRIIAKSNALMTVKFHRNFMIKTDQATFEMLMIVEVSYDDTFAFWGCQPWVASLEGFEPNDPWSAGDSEEDALEDFIYLMERGHV